MRKAYLMILLLSQMALVFGRPCFGETKYPRRVASVGIPDLITIEGNVPIAPPGWAVLERQLITVMSDAALKYTEVYTRSGGTLLWKTDGSASADDLF